MNRPFFGSQPQFSRIISGIRRPWVVLLAAAVVITVGCSSSSSPKPTAMNNAAAGAGGADDDDDDNSCMPTDADGVNMEAATLLLNVDDTTFTPKILKTQNLSMVKLTLTNNGTTPHSFAVDCMPTPDVPGCPPQSCFDDDSTIEPVAPGESKTVMFITPNPEGIYVFRSTVAGDTMTGQFILN